MGEGRNALWLAAQGWDVTGYDLSDVGLEIARKEAAALGVKLTTVKSAAENFDHGRDVWDLVVITYGPTTAAIGRVVHDALKPGGVVVVENYYSPAAPRDGNPRTPAPTHC